MKTTRKQALLIYRISKWLDPYGVCDLDKKEIVDSIESLDYEENEKQLFDFICEGYEIEDLLKDKELIRLLNLLYKAKNKEVKS